METIYSTPRQAEREMSQNVIITVLNIVNMNSQSCVSFMRELLHLFHNREYCLCLEFYGKLAFLTSLFKQHSSVIFIVIILNV
jgi:hypothetical protein